MQEPWRSVNQYGFFFNARKRLSQAEIEKEFERLRAADKDGRATFGERWLNDRGLLLDDGALEVAKKAHQAFFTKTNSSSAIMPLESELVSWVLNLFHGERGAAVFSQAAGRRACSWRQRQR